jgi:hypothetical protein
MTSIAIAGDLSDAVLSCSLPIEVTRFQKSAIVKGRKQAKSPCDTFRLMASVQPLSQKMLARLPEGTRAEGTVVVFSKEPLKTVRTSEAKQADEFCYNGVDYQVQSVEDWHDLGGYFMMTATRLDR